MKNLDRLLAAGKRISVTNRSYAINYPLDADDEPEIQIELFVLYNDIDYFLLFKPLPKSNRYKLEYSDLISAIANDMNLNERDAYRFVMKSLSDAISDARLEIEAAK